MVWLAAPLVAFLAFAPWQQACGSGPQKVRQAGVAGSFYPADPKVLSAMIDDLLAHATPPPIHDPILAVVAPHAGYQFSGPVAATTYAELKGRKFSRVVVIGPTHYMGFGFTSVYDGDAYATPLGTVPVDKAFAQQLVKLDPTLQLSGTGHDITPAGAEHSIEVQLPWLQRVLGNFQLVPIVMGDPSYGACRALGIALAKAVQGTNTLILVSSDLSHYHPYDEAERMDHQILKTIEDWDYLTLSQNIERDIWKGPCGGGPIVAAMIAAERLGAHHAQILMYANSGDVTGDKSRVVGYGAVALVAEKENKKHGRKSAEFSLTPAEKQELLKIARQSVETAVREKKLYSPPADEPEALRNARGAFVTLKEHGELRGCIGYTAPIKPLYLTVRDTATHAALHDPRFPPVTAAELPSLAYEISVLSPLRRVTDIQQIRVGEHGLLMKNGDSEGLLLPQVPVEQKWDRQTFLEQTCRKAGMDSGCWKDDDTDIFAFTAVVFHEQKP